MKVFLFILFLLPHSVGLASISKDSIVPLDSLAYETIDTIHKTNGALISCKIKAVGDSEIAFIQGKKSKTIRMKKIDHINYSGGEIVYYNSQSEDNIEYQKGKSRFRRSGSAGKIWVTIGYSLIAVAGFLALFWLVAYLIWINAF